MQPAIAKHYDRETAREAARREAHDQQTRRHRGVSFGGMAPSPWNAFTFVAVTSGCAAMIFAAQALAQGAAS